MHEYESAFKDKKITILGLGLLGRSVGDAEFLASCGAQVTVTDKKTPSELRDSVERLKQYPNIVLHLGGHDLNDFTSADLVIKAAGVRQDSPEIAAARDAGVPVAMSTAVMPSTPPVSLASAASVEPASGAALAYGLIGAL